MFIFIIGSTTPFPKHIADYLNNAGHKVILFGRDTLDYTSPVQMEEAFSKYPKPDIVVFNQRVNGGASGRGQLKFPSPITASSIDGFNKFIKDTDKNLQQTFYGKIAIVEILKDCKQFVFITSSITRMVHKYGFENLSYRYLRASEQQLMKCIALEEGKKAYGLCPGGMNLDIELFAIATAKIINGELNNNEYLLMNAEVSEVSKLMKEYTQTELA